MQLLEAKAKNFLSFIDFEYNYSSQGLTNIDGDDEDLNVKTGAGKSAFMDVPCYALFGKTSKNLNADEVINWETNKNLEVHLKFETESGIYEVHRYRKHKERENDFYIIGPDGKEMRGENAIATQKMLDYILGFDYNIFKKAIYFGQFDETDEFLRATDTKKKELISKICDLSAYDEKLEHVKAELKEDNEYWKDLRNDKNIKESAFNAIIQHLESIKKAKENWDQKLLEKIKELETKIIKEKADNDNKIKLLQEKSDEWEVSKIQRINDIKAKINAWEGVKQDKIKQLKESSIQWQENIKSLTRTLQKDIDKTEEELKLAQENLSVEENKGQVDCHKRIEEIEAKIKALKVKEQEGNKLYAEKCHLEKLNNNLKSIIVGEQQKKANGIGSECPHCYQLITGEAIDKKIESLYDEGKARAKEIEKTQAKIDEINKEMLVIEDYNKELKDVLDLQSKQRIDAINLRTLKDKVVNLMNSINDKKSAIKLENNRQDPYIETLKNIEEEKNPHLASIDFIQKEENKYLKEIEKIKNYVSIYLNILEKTKTEENPYIKNIEESEAEINKQTESLSKLNKEIKEIEHKIKLGEFWKAGLGTYIKSMLMDSFLEQLNIRANEYLETLFNGVLKINLTSVTEGKKGVKEKIDQKIFNGNHECSYNALSGGERCRICLAINLSISDITCQSLNKTFSLMMLDEILNGLDDEGKKQTMKLLKELEVKYDTILVIDHTEDFKSLFNNVITVKKRGGISRLIN